MSANTTVYSGYPMMQVQPQMGMYPSMVPTGFAPQDADGGAVIVTNYNH